MTRRLLCLDLSTTATGWSIFDLDTKILLEYGVIKPQKKGLAKLGYPEQQLRKLQDLSDQLKQLLATKEPIEVILIEEINRGIARLTQKVLDALHFMFLDRIEHRIKIVRYRDSDGATGWRKRLGLRLTEADKELNRINGIANRRRKKGTPKLKIINKKHLACRFVNLKYGTTFNVDVQPTDGDICDSIGLGHSYLYQSDI